MSTANPNRVRASVSAQEPSGVRESTHTLTGLSEADLGLLVEALATHREAAPVGMDYRHVDTLRAKIVDAWIWYA